MTVEKSEATQLAELFMEVRKNPDKMRGLKRRITLGCQRREAEGGNPDYFVRVIRQQIRRLGGDPTELVYTYE